MNPDGPLLPAEALSYGETGMTKPDPGLQRERERGELKGHREAPKAVEAMLQRTPWGGAPVQYSYSTDRDKREKRTVPWVA